MGPARFVCEFRQVRVALRCKSRLKGNKTLAVLIQDGVKALMDAGVVKPVADDDVRGIVATEGETRRRFRLKEKPKAKAKVQAKRGRKTVWFEKCSWAEVCARPEALKVVTNLQLTADSFHSH